MEDTNLERWARATGVVFVALAVVAVIVLGTQPKVGDSASEIASFYDGDRGRVMTAAFIFAVSFLFLVCFVAAIASALSEAKKGGWAATTIALGAAFVGLQTVILGLAGGLSLNIAATGEAGILQALNTVVATIDIVSAVPLAGLIASASIGLRRTRLVPGWLGWLGLVAAPLVLLRGTNWAESGFWSPTGGYSFVAIVAFLAWTLITSVMLYVRAPAPAAMPARAVATPAP